MYLRIVALSLLGLVLSCKRRAEVAVVKDEAPVGSEAKPASDDDCSRRLLASRIDESAFAPTLGDDPAAAGLRLDEPTAAAAAGQELSTIPDSAQGDATITPSKPTTRRDCLPPDQATQVTAAGQEIKPDGDGLALGVGNTVAGIASPFFVKGIETMFGTDLWDKVKGLPFESKEICEGDRKAVACTPLAVQDVDGKCYETGLAQYAKSSECRYACGRCVNPLEHIAKLHSYLKALDGALKGVDFAAKYSPKAKGLVEATVEIVKTMAAAVCSTLPSDGTKAAFTMQECFKSKIFEGETWKSAREKLGNVVAVGNCVNETLGTMKLAMDLVLQMAGKADYGYLADGPVEGMLNFGCSALAVVTNCAEVPGGLKAALAPVKKFIDTNPYMDGLAATCTLSKAVADTAVCNAARNSCLLQVHSYARPVEVAREATGTDGKPTNVKGCCLCQYEGRNWLGPTSGQVECERGLALPSGSQRKDCRYVTVESKTCSLATTEEVFDDASRMTGSGMKKNPLKSVRLEGDRITSVVGTIEPPVPPIFFWEYGIAKTDPRTGAQEWGQPGDYSYTWHAEWGRKRNWFENLQHCSSLGYRLPTVGELGFLRSSILAKAPALTQATTYSLSPSNSKPNDPWYYFYPMGVESAYVMQPGYATHTVCVKRL